MIFRIQLVPMKVIKLHLLTVPANKYLAFQLVIYVPHYYFNFCEVVNVLVHGLVLSLSNPVEYVHDHGFPFFSGKLGCEGVIEVFPQIYAPIQRSLNKVIASYLSLL